MREFLTASDVETLFAQGIRQIPGDEQIVLTDLARERVVQLGMALAPKPGSAPARPTAQSVPHPRPVSSAACSREIPTPGPRPRGCLHSHIEAGAGGSPGNPPADVPAPPPSGPVVQQLIEMIRCLNK